MATCLDFTPGTLSVHQDEGCGLINMVAVFVVVGIVWYDLGELICVILIILDQVGI